MTLSVEIARESSPELLVALNHLVPQLSSSAPALTMSELDRLITSSASTLFVALSDGAYVGTLTLVTFVIPSGRRAWIEDVVVDEAARGLGVGEALTTSAIAEARRRGVRSIDLTSRPTRAAANALYRKMGFEQRVTNVYRFFIES
ncbi:MAG TPA: GNAT family N-acetyltransferase [Acidimicrobiales bacterium]|nr:GNAT family N-acetyltransferase [Acidimicrobiales bacterium]